VSNKPEDIQHGLDALEKLGEPEQSSRTPDFDGRRLVRVDGGYIVLNFGKYRERDYTAAKRQRRYRERHKNDSNAVTPLHNAVTSRKQKQSQKQIKEKEGANGSRPTSDLDWIAELCKDPTYRGIDVEIEYAKMHRWCEVNKKQPTRRRFINWLNRAERPLSVRTPTRQVYGKNRLPAPNNISDEELATKRAQVRELSAKLRDELKK